MTLKFYNTLTRKKEVFRPISKGVVRLYTCGPTVYDYAHLGNFRAYVFNDVLKRYLEYKGYKVRHIMNITDVDDKTIKNSQKEGVSLKEFTDKYTKAFFEDLEALNIKKADIYPRATEYIDEMVKLIKGLLRKGLAYRGDDSSVYYDISKFRDYGKFARIKQKSLKAGARVSHDEYDKDHASDFALWKAWDRNDGDVFWKTELGKGRPGWHIECSAMSIKNLGTNFDIHCGGVDLIFPHHQNEIAQSEGFTGKKFVNYWLHNEHLLVDYKKMSKSLGNFYTLRDLTEAGYEPIAVRYQLLITNYRQKLNFSFEGVKAAQNTVKNLNNFYSNLKKIKGGEHNPKIASIVEKAKNGFEKQMDNDLDISAALGRVFDMIKSINKLIKAGRLSQGDAKLMIAALESFDKVIGVLGKEDSAVSKGIGELIKMREKARVEKDFITADKIRADLRKKGVILEDTPQGVRWKRA